MTPIAEILGVEKGMLESLDKAMSRATGNTGVLTNFEEMNEAAVRRVRESLGIQHGTLHEARHALREVVLLHERQLVEMLRLMAGKMEFEKAAILARGIAHVGKGFFLKKEYAQKILEECPPPHLLEHFGAGNIQEFLRTHDVLATFSALRFMESDEWMHETFEKAYSTFTWRDFEERAIAIEVLGPEWHEVAKKFVEKKHHNVSHLKEFGVIFINPVAEDIAGKFLRDFALLFHYFHEIEFYSKLFKRYAGDPDFASTFKMLLRGDVPEARAEKEGEWLIVQRYLAKIDPKDPRLFLPRVNPESLHWARGERDLVEFGAREAKVDLEFWRDLDWTATLLDGELVSFDLEDNAMSAVSYNEGKQEFFTYHQKEAMWTKLFSLYAGGEAEMEEFLMLNFTKGIIRF